MTTVFGIYHPEAKASVLVADRQSTSQKVNNGPVEKQLGRKLWIANGRELAFGHSGLRDTQLEDFAKSLVDGKYDVEKIIKEGNFPELRELNLKRLGNKVPDLDSLSGIVMVTRFGKEPGLYTCFPLGAVEPRGWVPIGSGSKKVTEYMDAKAIIRQAQDYLIRNSKKGDVRDLIEIGLEAVRRSQSQDIYSSGLDMVVCTPDGINDHFTDLQDDFTSRLRSIQRGYAPEKSKVEEKQ